MRSIGDDDGLGNVTVTALCQDEFEMMWLGTQDGLFRYDGVNMTAFRPVPGDSTSIYSNNIKAMTADLAGRLYVISKYALSIMDFRTGKFHTVQDQDMQALCSDGSAVWAASSKEVFSVKEHSLIPFCSVESGNGRITALLHQTSGNLFIGTSNGLFESDANGKISRVLSDIHVLTLSVDSRQNLWVGTRRKGAICISPDGRITSFDAHAKEGKRLSSDYVRSIGEDIYGNCWIGTLSGVDLYDIHDGSVTNVEGGSIYSVVKDSQNSIWVSKRGGVSLYNPYRDIFTSYKHLLEDMTLSAIAFDEHKGILYFASEDKGIKVYDVNTGESRFINGLSSKNIHGLYLDSENGILWAGTRFGGLNRIDTRQMRVTNVIGHDNVYKMCPAGDKLIVSTNNGVVSVNLKDFSLAPVTTNEKVSGRFSNDVFVDRNGNCWIAVSEGICRVELQSGSNHEYFFEDKGVFGTSHISTSFQDSKGRLWFGTSGSGLLLYDYDTDSFQSFNSANSAIRNNYILSIAELSTGYLLVATSSGLSRFDVEKGEFQNFDSSSGFPFSGLLTGSVIVTADDLVYVASRQNVISFRNNRLEDKKEASRLLFYTAEIDGGQPQSLLYSNHLDLDGRTSVVSITTSVPDYLSTVHLEYRLEELSNRWIATTSGQKIVYSGLSPGTYHLQLRCTDNNVENKNKVETLEIRVHPRWFATSAAKGVYSLLILLALGGLFIFIRSRSRMRQSEAITQSKLQFFTYISHEIRTPVTLIQGQVESLLQKGNVPPHIYNKVLGIQRNLGRINSLLGELMDFRKQEANKLQVRMSEGNISELLERVSIVFREYAAGMEIGFSLSPENLEPAVLWYDSEQIEKVLYNLLSNAFKNTPKGGNVSLSLAQSLTSVLISVSDTGIGISQKNLEHIFDPFFQVPGGGSKVHGGTGLGLAITKGIIDAHHGTINCRSKEGEGTVFEIMLPKGESHIEETEKCAPAVSNPQTLDIPDSKFVNQIKDSQGDNTHTILIVEDNAELRESLASLFGPIYNVQTAVDGQDAWSKLQSDTPDIILSDLMMPGIDGNELCAKVKSNVYTSHIPFVMLTAKVSEESMLESLRYGADDYISKPFNTRVLISKCNNLVNTRVTLQRRFADSKDASPEIMATNRLDKEFLTKAAKVVEENLSNSEFDVAAFAQEMALGRTRLFSKIKGVTGLTPNKFISTIRLRAAIDMLEHSPEMSLSDISYATGFNSPSYFIRIFKSTYGVTPSAYRSSAKEGGKNEG